jgi:hypothetical protein
LERQACHSRCGSKCKHAGLLSHHIFICVVCVRRSTNRIRCTTPPTTHKGITPVHVFSAYALRHDTTLCFAHVRPSRLCAGSQRHASTLCGNSRVLHQTRCPLYLPPDRSYSWRLDRQTAWTELTSGTQLAMLFRVRAKLSLSMCLLSCALSLCALAGRLRPSHAFPRRLSSNA